MGLTLEQALKEGVRSAHIRRTSYENLDRAVCESEPDGFVKVVADRRDKILGVHIIGAGAGEALAVFVKEVVVCRKSMAMPSLGERVDIRSCSLTY